MRTTAIGQSHWFACGRPEQRRMYADAVKAAREAAHRNRYVVLRHPDLAAQLVTQCGYRWPEQWGGYIPPRFVEQGDAFGYPVWDPNDSAARAVLVELVAAAEARGAP